MTDKQREIAESLFERNQRRETEINDALKQEYARGSYQEHVSSQGAAFDARYKIK
jgi:hypothetical protein